MRVAIFFTPAADDPLTEAASAWLTRDAFAGQSFSVPRDPTLSPDEIRGLVAEPRRYGFHATLKAPFRLAPEFELRDVAKALAAFARNVPLQAIPSLRIEQLGPFFALTPAKPNAGLEALAADVVETFDRFRAPLTADEIARRRPATLTPSQAQNLERWGYPYVMDEFRFHMTLTGPVAADRQKIVAAALGERFAPFLDRPLPIDALAIFVEPKPGSDFRVETRCPCGEDGFAPTCP